MWMRIGHINQGPFHWHDEPNRDSACGAQWPVERDMPADESISREWVDFDAACILAGLEQRSIVSTALACLACADAMPAAARAYAVREGFEVAAVAAPTGGE